MNKPPKRVIMRIDLTPASHAAFSAIPGDRGMTQVAVTSRLTEWFCRQPKDLQREILMADVPASTEMTVKVLRQMQRA